MSRCGIEVERLSDESSRGREELVVGSAFSEIV
jgi:hypothetical protein